MYELRSTAQEAAEDIFFGQEVIIWARWFVILGSAIVTLWSATTAGQLTIRTLLVVALMASNFYLHGRYLLEQPANKTLLLGLSLLDLLSITLTVLTWQRPGGLQSQFFVFYYPILVAFAFVFPPRLTAAYTGGALIAYLGACLLASGGLPGTTADLKLLVMRLITLAAMSGLSTYYWRIQRQRRRVALGGAGTLEELQTRLRTTLPAE